MGTMLQERVPQHCLERTTERGWKKKPPWSSSSSSSRPNAASNKMGRRQSQRKSPQPKQPLPSQDSHEKRFQQRKKHKTNIPSTKSNISAHSAQGTSVPKLRPSSRPPTEDEMEPEVQQVQPTAPCCSYKDKKHRGSRRGSVSASRRRRRGDSSPDPLERCSPNLETGRLSSHVEGDSDTDLSDSERRPESPSSRVPPQLNLRPEVIEAEDMSSRGRRPRGHGGFDFPDFLPPPFNSWSLSQLAVFYNTEGRTAPRPRPVGPLERYLERLLQLEWCQIQNQEDSGKLAGPEVGPGCHRSPASASSRLSSPKCILQCQRAFPLTFLSSLASHSALLSGCACTLCRMRYSTCGVSCGRSAHGHVRQSRLSPTLEHRGTTSLPKRSYSESRAHCLAQRAPRFSSPVRANSHMRQMQALGNIRNPSASTRPHSARDLSSEAGRDWLLTRGEVLDYRTGAFRKRSGSEQRKSTAERQQNASERRRSGSECRRGGSERRRAAELKEGEIKPDAVTAIMDNLPGSRIRYLPGNRPNRPKQVDFVT